MVADIHVCRAGPGGDTAARSTRTLRAPAGGSGCKRARLRIDVQSVSSVLSRVDDSPKPMIL